jgi:hypothetical protein
MKFTIKVAIICLLFIQLQTVRYCFEGLDCNNGCKGFCVSKVGNTPPIVMFGQNNLSTLSFTLKKEKFPSYKETIQLVGLDNNLIIFERNEYDQIAELFGKKNESKIPVLRLDKAEAESEETYSLWTGENISLNALEANYSAMLKAKIPELAFEENWESRKFIKFKY